MMMQETFVTVYLRGRGSMSKRTLLNISRKESEEWPNMSPQLIDKLTCVVCGDMRWYVK